ncbi:Diphthamide biosynthesis protein 7 [Thelohanellus kitauei]|uniref:methylated diphthine methylhydrolase n=1 Tax=Thelohanellus kitauei TaxID=669202 RepID=A0A0C2JUX2_THEKT|nr:Diphthamide biosynthesis protein 7 [Thelohanellus kitauei]
MTTCSVETERSEKLQVLSVYPIKDRVWFSTASGGVGMVKLVESSYILVSKFDASKFESWSVVSHPRSIDVAYASDDFGSIRIFDARTSKISQFTKYHHYGVCSLSFPEQVNDNLVCSGGFDHTLCFWDTRSTDKPISNFQPGYCVWAIRWFSHDKIALVSATDSGSYILKFDQNYQKHSEAIHYDRPQSLVYSSEICKVHTNNSSSYRICSTSFYDSLLHLWNFNTGLLKKRLYDQM